MKIPTGHLQDTKQSPTGIREPNKIPVTFNDTQWNLIENFRPMLGDSRAELVRSIVLDWLLDKFRGVKP